MQVKFVAGTTHPEMSPEEFLAYCARVSNPSNQMNHESSAKLLRYLINNAHWSPLEMASATLEIVTTRDIARQILRHRSFSFQEFSQRYADVTQGGLNFVKRDARLQDTKNRQNSIETEDEELLDWWDTQQQYLIDDVDYLYREALRRGIAKEQARAVLPEGITESRLYMSGTIRSWVHYCDLRSSNGTQAEHMEVAKAASNELNKIYPSLFKVYE